MRNFTIIAMRTYFLMSVRYMVSSISLIPLFLHRSEGSHFTGMDYSDSRRKPHFLGKVLMAAILVALCIFILKQSPGFGGDSAVSFQTFPFSWSCSFTRKFVWTTLNCQFLNQ